MERTRRTGRSGGGSGGGPECREVISSPLPLERFAGEVVEHRLNYHSLQPLNVAIPWSLLDDLAEVGKCNELREGLKEFCSWAVGHWINAHLDEFLPEKGGMEDAFMARSAHVL
uniref:Uncharacterized protein n=1 Tax=Oryza punctata TaxID=4537 RepID=A0A0E0L9F8_ORYPU